MSQDATVSWPRLRPIPAVRVSELHPLGVERQPDGAVVPAEAITDALTGPALGV
jgi:hypothetical protein